MDEILNEKRLSKLETKIDNINDKINEMSKDVKVVSSNLTDHIHSEERLYSNLDKKYSGKWVEVVALAILAVLVAGFISLALK